MLTRRATLPLPLAAFAAAAFAQDKFPSRPVKIINSLAAGSATDASAIRHTRDYLQRFEDELARSADSAALIAAMQRAYPEAGLGVALDIGAKVNKGEMKW